MPLVRLQVRNEYGLGQPELYKETNREDPKAVLDGVAVAGLVGILRQLGDLADFAAEVFHGLQEQVLTTASRSHKLMLRAQNIEASLPPLEKAILTQTSHIHFAYTAGCEWHCRTKTAQNHFIYNDLPQFIMDSYEECRDPPRLHLLDKFDSGGPGSCLRRYSDPTFFKRASAYSDEAYSEKIERARKTCRSKKKRLSQRKGGILLGEHMHSNSGRMQFASHVNGKTSSLQTASPVDMMPKSDPEDHSDSFDSKTGAGYIECVFHSRNSVQPDEQEYEESSSRLTQKTDTLLSASPALDDNFSHDSFDKQIASTSTGLTWHEKEEIMDSKMQPCDGDKTPDVLAENQNLHMHEDEAVIPEKNHHNDFLNGVESNLEPVSSRVQTDEIDSEPDRYLDALNDIESESENDLDCEIKQEVEQFTSHITGRIMENGVDGATSTVRDHDLPDVVYEILSGVSINEETERDFLDSLQEIPPLISESHVSSFMSPAPSDVPVNIERTKNIVDSHASESPIYEQVPHRCDSCVLDCSVGTNPLDGAHTLNKTVSGSIQTDISSGSRSSDLPDKEADRDFPESLQEIPPPISELNGPSIRSPVPSDVPVKIERTKNLADSHASESPIMEQVPRISENSVLDCSVGTNPLGSAHTLNDTASVSIETDISSGSRSSDLPDKEADRDFPESLLEIPPLISEPHGTSLRSPVSSDVPVKIERTKNLADSHASESPIMEQVPHISENPVLDCSVGTNPLGGAHTLNDTASVSIETDISSGSRSSDLPDKEADRDFPESLQEIPSLISDPRGTSLISPVSSDVPVNIERTKKLADSHASESPITEQVPHISGNSVLDCSVGTNPLGGAHTLNDIASVSIETDVSTGSRISDLPDKEADRHFPESLLEIPPLISEPHGTNLRSPVLSDVPVKIERTKNLADSHASESPITEQVPHISGNSVLDCSIGTNPLGGAHTLNDTVSVSFETDISSGSRISDLPDKEADRHFPESLLEIPPLISEPHGTSLRSPVSSDVPVKIERTKNLADSHTSESPITEHLPHISGNSVLDCSVGTNPLGGAHTLNDTVSVSIETDISSGSRSSDLPDKEADRINSNICKFEETPSESAIDHSISLWTNGGLLGLEPSKPPDFIISSSLTSINVTGGPSNHNSMLKSNGYEEEQDLSAEVAELKQEEPSSRCSTSHSDEQACISVKTSDCHHLRNGFGQKDEEDLDKIKVLAPGNALPVADNTRAACTEPNQGSRENSPLAFRLSHRSLINSFCRKVSFDEKSGPDNSLETGILELSGQNSIVHQSLPETPFKEQVSCGYTIDTPPPSPPLEHMKISFHPIIKVETSKLKLKFPDGSSYHESTRDVFPSFQLVPELFIPLHDSGSNSDDDDTFCRSSPYVSDDCLSPHSDYNSDQWESGDTSDSSYPGVYDSSHRISLTESKFSSQDIRGVTNVDINLDSGHSMYTQDSAEPSLYGPLLDFPSFDTMNFVLDKEYNKYSDYKNNLKLQSHAEPTPPPFPPKQWGESNLQLDMMNEMQNYISEDSGQINDPNILESTLQLRPSQVEQNKTDLEFYDDISCNLKDKLNQQNLNGQKKENQVGTGKDTDEREDFLQQIRTKSFNLRHAVTGKPSASTGPATNGKVTAILEKVNAIRQVVTSDDGEDDNWSDT